LSWECGVGNTGGRAELRQELGVLSWDGADTLAVVEDPA
jgi:hypothetical protein